MRGKNRRGISRLQKNVPGWRERVGCAPCNEENATDGVSGVRGEGAHDDKQPADVLRRERRGVSTRSFVQRVLYYSRFALA